MKPLPPPADILLPERRSAAGYDLGDPAELERFERAVSTRCGPWRAASIVGGGAIPAASTRDCRSPADRRRVIGRVDEADEAGAAAAVASASAAFDAWSSLPVAERAAAIERWGDAIEADVDELVARCVHEAGKTIADAIADVREAVDFCRYYAAQARGLMAAPLVLPGPTGERNELALAGRGPFACIAPWNFPVAIFVGQAAAALAVGNTVIAKPAEQTPLVAHRLVTLAHAAGVPAGALALLLGPGHTAGAALVAQRGLAGVAFTGSNATAKRIQRALCDHHEAILPLVAETGGVNTMLVDSSALPEQVADAVLASAFRSAGQRCSALRVLALQDDIADAQLEMIRGAMATLAVGDPADPATDVGPLIDEDARDALVAHLDAMRAKGHRVEQGPLPAGLEHGVFFAPALVGIDSFEQVGGEHFGPVLHVLRYPRDGLRATIAAINRLGYGLTMGLQTRLDARAALVRRHARVGNLYVNRNMIGAVVGVQPFGGEGLSGTGPKAGGPNYLMRFVTERVYCENVAAAGGDVALVAGG